MFKIFIFPYIWSSRDSTIENTWGLRGIYGNPHDIAPDVFCVLNSIHWNISFVLPPLIVGLCCEIITNRSLVCKWFIDGAGSTHLRFDRQDGIWELNTWDLFLNFINKLNDTSLNIFVGGKNICLVNFELTLCLLLPSITVIRAALWIPIPSFLVNSLNTS